MSQRMLLVAALALMAGGLLLGGIGLVMGGGATPVQSRQPFFGPNGPNGQQGPQGGAVRPGWPGTGPETERGEGPERPFPGPTVTPKPKVSPTP